MSKRFFWLKLKEDFFDEKYVKALRRLPQGDSLAVVYLKMQLKSLKTEGIIKYEGILPDSIAELAMALDEDEHVVRLAVQALVNFGVVERWDDETLYMSAMQQMIGSESESAARVRKHRELRSNAQALPSPKAKTNAQRQRAFRAKKASEEHQHVPRCEDYDNLHRYSGNYYVVMKRDQFKCSICNSIENICVHHIDGYDEAKPQNNAENKMVVLCRSCHSRVHAGLEIPNDVLERIDYFIDECNEDGNDDVTPCNTEIEKEIELETDKDKDKEKEKEKAAALPSDDIEKEFESLWSLYPRKQGKANALKAYKKARKGHPDIYDAVADGIKAYLAYLKANKTEQKFVAQGSTWFNQQRWMDDYSTGGKEDGRNGKSDGDIEKERVSKGGYRVRKDLFL